MILIKNVKEVTKYSIQKITKEVTEKQEKKQLLVVTECFYNTTLAIEIKKALEKLKFKVICLDGISHLHSKVVLRRNHNYFDVIIVVTEDIDHESIKFLDSL